MAFRGRGRGRGGYGHGGGFGAAKQEPFVLFPVIEKFPDASNVTEETALAVWSSKLQKFWNSSPYYLKDEGPKKEERIDIERFSDRGKQGTERKHRLSDFVLCSTEYVPAELAQDSKPERYGRRKVRWNQESDLQKLDLFEKLEEKYQGQGEKGEKEKQEGENEEEDDDRIEEEDEEFSDDGDYNQNIDFDDDEDDFNMDDDHDGDEGIY